VEIEYLQLERAATAILSALENAKIILNYSSYINDIKSLTTKARTARR
jgi:hypothetical protein